MRSELDLVATELEGYQEKLGKSESIMEPYAKSLDYLHSQISVASETMFPRGKQIGARSDIQYEVSLGEID